MEMQHWPLKSVVIYSCCVTPIVTQTPTV